MHLEIFGKIVGRWLAVRFDASSLPLLPSLPFQLGAGGKERGRRDLPIYTPNPLRVCIPAVCSRPASHPRGFSHSGIRLVGFLLASGRPRPSSRNAASDQIPCPSSAAPWNSPSGITRSNHPLLLLQNRGRSVRYSALVRPPTIQFWCASQPGKMSPRMDVRLYFIFARIHDSVSKLYDRMMFKVGERR